eukprot:scaffold4422_cov196-Ochromonas_danica.AAC.1
MVAQGPEEGFDNRDLTALYLPLTLPQGCIPAIVQRHHKMLKTLHASQLEKREITPFDLLQAVSPTAYDQHYRVYREHYLRSTAEEVPRGKMWKEWCKTLRALPPPPPHVATPTALTAMRSAYRLRHTNSVEKGSEDLLRACMDWSSAGLANARADEIAHLIDSPAYMHTLPLLNASEEVLAIACYQSTLSGSLELLQENDVLSYIVYSFCLMMQSALRRWKAAPLCTLCALASNLACVKRGAESSGDDGQDAMMKGIVFDKIASVFHFYKVSVQAEKETSHSVRRFIQQTARKENFVSFKLDINTASVQVPIAWRVDVDRERRIDRSD